MVKKAAALIIPIAIALLVSACNTSPAPSGNSNNTAGGSGNSVSANSVSANTAASGNGTSNGVNSNATAVVSGNVAANGVGKGVSQNQVRQAQTTVNTLTNEINQLN